MQALKRSKRGSASLGQAVGDERAATFAVHSFPAELHGSVVPGLGGVGRIGVAACPRVVPPQRGTFTSFPAREPVQRVGGRGPSVGLGTVGRRSAQDAFGKQQKLRPSSHRVVEGDDSETANEGLGPPPTGPVRNITKSGSTGPEYVVQAWETGGVLRRWRGGRDGLTGRWLGSPIGGPTRRMHPSARSDDEATYTTASLVVASQPV